MKKIFSIFILTFLLISCGPRIYTVENIDTISSQHSTIAILPPKVSIEAQKKVSAEALIEQQKTESINFQKEMYSWLLKRKSQDKLNVNVQDIATTKAKLLKAGYENDGSLTPKELCDILDVDAVLSSNYSLSKPMSQGAAIAAGVLFGAFGSTNKTVVDLSLHDKANGEMFWNYNHKANGSFSSPNALVDVLMRNASKKLPYIKK